MREVEKIREWARKAFKTSQGTNHNHVNSVDNKGQKKDASWHFIWKMKFSKQRPTVVTTEPRPQILIYR